MACTVADIVIRRTELGAEGKPPDAITTRLAGVAAEELKWDAMRVEREIQNVNAFYAV